MSTQQPEALAELRERLRSFEADHTPDGWPAVRMRDITALLDDLDNARSDNRVLRLGYAAARLEVESLKAQLHAAKQINAAQFGLLAASIPGSALRASRGQAPAETGNSVSAQAASKEQTMTDKPTPTDAELEALLLDKLPASKHYIRPVIEKMVAAMQAAIDKWGQPVVAGDVDRADAVNLARNALTQYDCAITKKGVRVLAEAVLSMDSALTTPQPTQAQAAEPVAWAFKYDDGTWHDPSTAEHSSGMRPLFAAPQPVAREPLPKFLALKFYARRDKKATVTLLFPGHEAADAWVRGIKGGQHGTESST